MQVSVWTINRACDLLEGQDKAVRRIFAEADMGTVFGERGVPAGISKRQLMPNVEYFVPIPLKCIGSRYRDTGLDADGQALLRSITEQYEYFRSEAEFKQWWSRTRKLEQAQVEETFGRQHMTTPDGVGYYELLEPHENNVLIGYSQGGLVARYLAFLDRHVFKKNKIAAVITIASPNYGSPLANPDNKNAVAAGIVQFLSALISLHRRRFPHYYGEIAARVNFEALYAIIAAAERESRGAGGEEEHGAHSLLETAVKWFSGLNSDPNSAFDELDINNYLKPYSVLSLLNGGTYSPDGVYTGSVISGNADLDEILRSVLVGEQPNDFWDFLKQKGTGIVVELVKRLKLFGIKIDSNVDAAGDVYASLIMRETLGGTATDLMRRLSLEYMAGKTDVPKVRSGASVIPAAAHDFIIPSVYQVLEDNEWLLGNYLNLDASHNSGSSTDFRAGEENRDAIYLLLKRLRDALRARSPGPLVPGVSGDRAA